MTVLAAEGMAVDDHYWLDSVRRITRTIEPALVTGATDREMLHHLDDDHDRLAVHARRYGQRATVVPAATLFGLRGVA